MQYAQVIHTKVIINVKLLYKHKLIYNHNCLLIYIYDKLRI